MSSTARGTGSDASPSEANRPGGIGRIEATEIDSATKLPGRLGKLLVREGDFVESGQPLAEMQIDVLGAQRDEARAIARHATNTVTSALAQVSARQGQEAVAQQGIDAGYFIYRKLSDFDVPSPSNAWVLVDEHEDSINGGGFVVDVIRRGRAAQVWDVPASYRGGAGGFSFAVGHVEIRKWRNARTLRPVSRQTVSNPTPAPASIDIAWLQERAAAMEVSR